MVLYLYFQIKIFVLGNTQEGVVSIPWISNLLMVFAKFMNANVKSKIQGFLWQFW